MTATNLTKTGIKAMAALALVASVAQASSEYDFLSFYQTSVANSTSSSTYYQSASAASAWLAAAVPNGVGGFDNSVDVWHQITWNQSMSITGAKVATWQQLGDGSTIGAWTLQYSADGLTSWTPVPTVAVTSGDTGGNGYIDVPFTSPVTAKALRVFFAAGSYTYGTANVHSGPGVATIQARGTVPGGIAVTDPSYDVIADQGVLGAVSISMNIDGTHPGENNPGNLHDSFVGFDAGRAGFYTPVASDRAILTDMGEIIHMTSFRLYGGTFYNYVPTSFDVYVSDANNFATATFVGTASSLSGSGNDRITQLLGSINGRYVWYTNMQGGQGGYALPQEVAIASPGIEVPEPASLGLLGLSVLALAARRRRGVA